jgi:hypothetical protein
MHHGTLVIDQGVGQCSAGHNYCTYLVQYRSDAKVNEESILIHALNL